jgi:hypothetical protein
MNIIFQSSILYHYYYFEDLVLEKLFLMPLLYRMNTFLIQKFFLQHNHSLQLIHAIHHPVDQMLYAGMNIAGLTGVADGVVFQIHLIQFLAVVVVWWWWS